MGMKSAFERADDSKRRGLQNTRSFQPETRPDDAEEKLNKEKEKKQAEESPFFVVDGRRYAKTSEYHGLELQIDSAVGFLADTYTATINGNLRTKDRWGHPEGARQEAEYAIRKLEEAAIARDRLKAALLPQYDGDEDTVEAILEHMTPTSDLLSSCGLERITP
jgi:hypothetical protein